MAPRQDSVFDETFPARVATALVLACVVLAVLSLGGVVWTLFLILVGAGAAAELGRLLECSRLRQQQLAAAIAVITGCTVAGTAWAGIDGGLLTLALLVPVASGLYALAEGHALALGAGAFYLGVPLASLVWLRLEAPGGAMFTLWLLLVVAATDTAAYFAGRTIGGPRLAPVLSPGKTWAGLIGGVIAATITGAVFVLLIRGHGPGAALSSGLLAAVLAVVSQCGDLTESWLKRRSGRKDSGHILPGHGGLLDRIDGLLFAAPLYAAVVALLTSGTSS